MTAMRLNRYYFDGRERARGGESKLMKLDCQCDCQILSYLLEWEYVLAMLKCSD